MTVWYAAFSAGTVVQAFISGVPAAPPNDTDTSPPRAR